MFNFIKTSIRGGFFVILPIILTWLLLVETIDFIDLMVSPITNFLPVESLGGLDVAKTAAVFLFILLSFLTGWIIKSKFGSAIVMRLEDILLKKIPGYTILKNISIGLSSDGSHRQFIPALVCFSAEIYTPALIIENHEDGRYTVYVPIAPTPSMGTIQIVAQDRVQKLNVSLGEFMNTYFHWGIGINEILIRHNRLVK